MAENMRDMTLNLIVNSQVGRIKDFNRNLKDTERTIDRTTKKTGWLSRNLGRIFITYFGVQGIKGMVNTYRNLDLVRRSIEGLTKSTQDWDYIQQQAFKTGTGIETVAKGYRNFYSAANMAGFDKSGIQEMYSEVLIASRAIGANQTQVNGALLALEQMLSKGKVSMEELRRQLGNALPGAFEIGAKAMGVTTQKFNEMVKAGINANEFVPKFTKELLRTYEKAFPEAVKSLDYAIVNLDSSWKLFQYDLMRGGAGQELAKVLNQISQLLQSNQLRTAIQVLGYIMEKLLVVIKFLIDNLGTILWLLSPIAIAGALTKFIVLLKDVIKWIYLGNLALNNTQLALFRIYLLMGWIEEIIAFFTPKEGLLETALLGKNQSWITRLERIAATLFTIYLTLGFFTKFKFTRNLIGGLFGKGQMGDFFKNKLPKWAGVEKETPKGTPTETPKTTNASTNGRVVGVRPNSSQKMSIDEMIRYTKDGNLKTALSIAYGLLRLSPTGLASTVIGANLSGQPVATGTLYDRPSIMRTMPYGYATQLSKAETYAPNITYNPQYKIDATGMTPEQLQQILEAKDKNFWQGLTGGIPKYGSLFPTSVGR